MLTSLKIKNFRSINDCNIKLGRVNVIVGANSTGKSNLIKAADFLFDISKYGFEKSINKRGGVSEIIPKQFKNTLEQEVSFDIDTKLTQPDNWPRKFGKLMTEYQFSVVSSSKNRYKLKSEVLKIKSVLLYSHFLKNMNNDNNDITLKPNTLKTYQNSQIIFTRNCKTNSIDFKLNFKLTKSNKLLFSNWLGIKQVLGDRINEIDTENFTDIIDSLLNSVNAGHDKNEVPIISQNRLITGLGNPSLAQASRLCDNCPAIDTIFIVLFLMKPT